MKKTPEEIEEIVRLQDPDQKLELIDSTGFRAGILDILMKDKPLVDAAGIAIVSRIAGTAVETFDTIDKDKSGTIEKGELAQLLKVPNYIFTAGLSRSYLCLPSHAPL